MFPFDPVSLPQISSRRALIAVDFQNDFVGPDGALPVPEPEGFLDRAASLAAAFREAGGDVVWVCSAFDKPRPVDEQILVSDMPPPTALGSSARGRRRPPPSPAQQPDAPIDPEAFLSHAKPQCLQPDSPGTKAPTVIQDAMTRSDMTLTKTHYSAFQGTNLLRNLRAKMVMEVFICGSLANVGVYATALDAAGHGMSITVIEDCCGYRSDARQMYMVNSLTEVTGCEIISAAQVLDMIQPKPPTKVARRPKKKKESSTPATRDAVPSAVDITQSMSKLKLEPESPGPASSAKSTSPSSQPANVKATSQEKPKEAAKAIEADRIEAEPATPTPELTQGVTSSPENTGKGVNDKDTAVMPAQQSVPGENAQDKNDEAAAIEPSDDAIIPAPPEPDQATPSKPEKTMDKQAAVRDDASDEQSLPFQQKGLCAGDTDIIENLLPPSLEEKAFDILKDEVRWQRMSHQGGDVPRLVAVQGAISDDGSMPVYRHPSDESPPLLPFSPTVLAIKSEAEKHLGHPLNHVLIQYYRDGMDYISEHSDKTLDIVRGSYIANVSLGARRTMVLRTKRLDKDPSLVRTDDTTTGTDNAERPTSNKRQTQRALLPHNSLCRMGLRTNMQWLHAIRQDKRADRDKTPAELAFAGGRISLTFRQIGTFLSADEKIIWGQGATGKTRAEAQPVINGQSAEAVRMLQAFGTENHSSTFDWEKHYGKGFDVLHMSSSPRFFASSDPIVNMRIAMMLAEFGIGYAKGSMGPAAGSGGSKETQPVDQFDESSVAVKLVDNDSAKSVVHGDIAIMLYLDARRAQTQATPSTPPELASRFSRFQQALDLLRQWRKIQRDSDRVASAKPELIFWDGIAASAEGGFMVSSKLCLVDFAVWPVLHDMVEKRGLGVFDRLDGLRKYYERVAAVASVQKVLGKTDEVEETQRRKGGRGREGEEGGKER
ncbi:hypothetical protein B0I35DRAFT_424269 [Stachybotrys elegans]|uniref:Fe2OG dioxygenase domain-containing protein n=1 Tax=Stachybotrys elegans TaxID=80388 RepID=A0A8K0STE5_9HYPO|nr:hypothetical protein B0I35DRAFT_424269 [Stachybotrys elegans]